MTLSLVALVAGVPRNDAGADTKSTIPDACPQGICQVTAETEPPPRDPSSSKSSMDSSNRSPARRSTTEIALRQLSEVSDANPCAYDASSPACQDTNVFAPPPDALVGPRASSDNANVPTMSPSEAGAIAVARLRLPVTPPKVGPDPNLNKWKMAAVGYPLWVWADGPTHVGPVSDSVGGLTVSLDAQLTKTVFRMGDGGTVTCVGAGTPYRNSTKPGTPSPSCGYRYEEPSLPEGNYTVSAVSYWAVTWTVNGTSGVITVPSVTSAPLPVGEGQVLRR